MASDLLIKSGENQSLDDFVSALRNILACDRWEQRDSANYVDERYYLCIALGVEITAAIADDIEFKDWPFWLHFEPHGAVGGDKRGLDGLAECVARALVLQSYEVLRPNDFGRTGSGATLYQLNEDKGVKLRDRVRVVTI